MNLTLQEKLKQMFILGFNGADIYQNQLVIDFLNNALGGIIFFTQNILDEKQFKNMILDIKHEASIPPFLSIDQEGGRVERTENIHNGKKYLSAKFAAEKGEDFFIFQTKEMIKELKDYGINLNFTPVLDVNTNLKNPIIGERAFSNKPDVVIKHANIVLNEYKKNKILTCGKHFPGHGASSTDSHKSLPIIDLPFEELEQIHIKPFKELIKSGLPSIMVAHVNYPAFDKDKTPASLSKNVLRYLITNLKFKGLIISDDMEMGGVQGFSKFAACKQAIENGVNLFIYRNIENGLQELIEDLEKSVIDEKLDEKLIDNSVSKILKIKKEYNII